MKHRVSGRHLNRSKKHRASLFKNLIIGVIEHGQIKTTLAKAKAIKPLIDRLITRSKKGNLHSRRILFSFFHQKPAVNKLMDEIAPRFKKRTSGFTRIVRLGTRKGDNAQIVSLEFVDSSQSVETKPEKKKQTKPKKVSQPVKTAAKTPKAQPASVQAKPTIPRTTHK